MKTTSKFRQGRRGSLFFLLINCLLCLSLYASVKCPKCQFENEDGERYCVNCTNELSPASEDEKQRLEAINKDRSLKAEAFRRQQKNKGRGVSGDSSKITVICKDGSEVALEDYAVKGAITVFDFYANWCGPCKALYPKLEALVQGKKNVYLKKINIVKWGSPVAKKYNINSIPSVWIFDKDCKQVASCVNGIENIKNAIEKIAE
jgi:thiol-disulfide isomerase/thioredoxin